ncbi:ATP-grasp domain-containing protein [Ruania halotolerans]|uniref:carboxylate--amine ligase n=1 Tax=Ruania halotolerans TaxID=2897773 RepID=UPI001E44A86B|nr:ATP-grasp domain-containing protein [Ruania halotolerans]UFU04787.1 ATP-grasp domain-containing protein [Ruania halotolerans]
MRSVALCPVLLGTDLGIYAMARSFHEAYGVRSVVISEQARGPINDSAILANVFTGANSSDTDTLAALDAVAAEHAEQVRLLVVNSDHQLAFVMRHRARLEEQFVVPYAAAAVVDRLADKRAMNSVLVDLGIPAPRTVEVTALPRDEQAWRAAAAALTFPLVMKPFAGAEFEELTFAGRRKVYRLADAGELVVELDRIAHAGYGGTMLLQELIPGDDTANRVVNCYRDARGELTMAASGQVLLAMHQPTFIGNSAVIMVDYDPALIEAVRRVLERVDYRGFASVDFKVDPRDGVARLLDINSRPGRSHYYANVGGASAARSVVADFVLGEALAVQEAREAGIYAYIPTFVLRRYIRDPELYRRVRAVLRRRKAVHPLDYAADRSLRRWWYRILAQVNQLRALRTFYPRPTDSGF